MVAAMDETALENKSIVGGRCRLNVADFESLPIHGRVRSSGKRHRLGFFLIDVLNDVINIKSIRRLGRPDASCSKRGRKRG
jgi:hypothetical protein